MNHWLSVRLDTTIHQHLGPVTSEDSCPGPHVVYLIIVMNTFGLLLCCAPVTFETCMLARVAGLHLIVRDSYMDRIVNMRPLYDQLGS